MGRRKEGNGTVQSANPDLDCAGIEIEGAFFVNLGSGIGGGKNLDADFGRPLKKGELANVLWPARGEPDDIDSFNAAGGGNRALRQGAAAGKELTQKQGNLDLALAVERSWRRTHKEMAVLIGLDAIREFRELPVGQDRGPTSQVEPGLRSEVRKLYGNRHGER